jgi:hypothetical protein
VEKTRDFLINLHEIGSISALFRSFFPVFTRFNRKVVFAAARREAFQLSRGPKAVARKSFYFKGKGATAPSPPTQCFT